MLQAQLDANAAIDRADLIRMSYLTGNFDEVLQLQYQQAKEKYLGTKA